MESRNLVSMVLTITVSLICIGAVLVPVLTDATTTEKTFTNDGYFRMTKYAADDTETVNVSWTYADRNVITVNDEDINISGPINSGVSALILSDFGVLRAGLGSNGSVSNVGYMTTDTAVYAEVGNSASISAEFASGAYSMVITSRGTSTTYTGTYSEIYVPDSNGEYIMKISNESAYILNNSDIVAYGVTNVSTGSSNVAVGFSIEGTIDNLDVNIWRGSGVTYTDPVVDCETVSGYNDLYLIDKITFTATYSETSTDTDVTYSYFLVPYQVTAELASHMSSAEIALIMTIPLMMILAVLFIGVRAVNRD